MTEGVQAISYRAVLRIDFGPTFVVEQIDQIDGGSQHLIAGRSGHTRKVVDSITEIFNFSHERKTFSVTGGIMQRTHQRQRMLRGVITGIIVVVSSLVVASPAHAYGALTVRYALVDTDNCARLAGTLPVIVQSDSCVLHDSADSTFFHKDAGGIAIKIELHDSNGMVAKQEFHPYGEVLWVYDTRNDGDGVYTWAWTGVWNGPYGPVGTSNTIDFTKIDMNLSEGQAVELWVYDDSAANEHIATIIGGRA